MPPPPAPPTSSVAPVTAPWAGPLSGVAAALELAHPAMGLTHAEVERRRQLSGRNVLPHAPPATTLQIALRQFKSPLIFILVAAAVVSFLLGEHSDALFIAIVLVANAIVGTIQERGAEQSAEALRAMLKERARVVRDDTIVEIDGADLVPGDVVVLEPGDKVPADLRLLSETGLTIDESMLTGESVPAEKDANADVARDAGLGDRATMACAGTLVARGHGRGLVVAIADGTALGSIAGLVMGREGTTPPLMVRMEQFTKKIALVVLVASAVLGVIDLSRGAALHEVFLMAVALAVSAIPEGLPIALTVALSLGARRMAGRRVIARRLVSVEALGSCTFIASDKTGTLTKNELTVRSVAFVEPEAGGDIVDFGDDVTVDDDPRWHRLATAIALDNEAALSADGSTGTGDAVDVAMLVFAHRLGVDRAHALHTWPRRCALAFEAERQYAASIHVVEGDADRSAMAFVKGAPERVVQMCATAAAREGDLALDREAALTLARRLAERGARVLAVAAGPVGATAVAGDVVDPAGLVDLTLLGFVGMIDPLRPEAKDAVAACRRAGIEVAMVTGDHPVTALAIAKELGIARADDTVDHVVTGAMLRSAVGADGSASTAQLDALVRQRAVFARIEPEQKLAIVESLQRAGHFVAVTGDGANDAPALRAAHIGVAMGARGTDVAKETAGLIVTDDNFASIVAGVEEGRVAYDNVRKVIFLAISTGAAEILIFALAVIFGTPLPLLPIQLLWMNLVTNGIQDVGLAFEPREREVLRDPPRRTDEAIFDRVMIQRVLVSATIMCAVSFAWFKVLLDRGVPIEMARNQMLLLMVLFENIHAGNCRSEHRSLLTHSPLRNPILFVGTAFVQGLHLVAMHVPLLADTLGLAPVSLADWLTCLGLSLTLFVAMELEKLWRRVRASARPRES